MPAHWLQVESCRAGFKSDSKMLTVRNARSLKQLESCRAGFKSERKARCSVFYPLKNALFSVGTMNADTDSASEESVKVIQGSPWYAIRTFDVTNNGQPP